MITTTNTNSTALQVTNFDFYGDNLIALQDNATCEIYTAITHVLRGIGFTDKQIEHQQNKILNDEILKSHTLKFSGVKPNFGKFTTPWFFLNSAKTVLETNNFTPKNEEELLKSRGLGVTRQTLQNYKKLTEMIPELEELVDTSTHADLFNM